MRTKKNLNVGLTEVNIFHCELDICPLCGMPLHQCDYRSGKKTVQHLTKVMRIAYQPKTCLNSGCKDYQQPLRSFGWQQTAPLSCTYGYDVIATLGFHRQEYYRTFFELYMELKDRVLISESQVRYLYYQQYLPLIACNERSYFDDLKRVSGETGLLLTLDGLAPEGGEAQLWVARELRTGLTLRSGWMSGQDQVAFENFLRPLAESGLHFREILSDKQRGLEPAIKEIFPNANHALCQAHYLKNIAEPVAEEDESMKVELRKAVRNSVGSLIRAEHVESPGLLTVTGLFPTEISCSEAPAGMHDASCVEESEGIGEEISLKKKRDEIIETINQKVRYLLTLKGRPPFRLAGIEMYERLDETRHCLGAMLEDFTDPRLSKLHAGISQGLQLVEDTYIKLRQAAGWLFKIDEILTPDEELPCTGDEVRQKLCTFLDEMKEEGKNISLLNKIAVRIEKTTNNYLPGLFYTYDVPDLPRTNNDRESEHRGTIRKILKTTGQKGATRRILLRSGAWETIPLPGNLEETIEAVSKVDPDELRKERERVRIHRKRFKSHVRSPKQSRKQLEQLEKSWQELAANS